VRLSRKGVLSGGFNSGTFQAGVPLKAVAAEYGVPESELEDALRVASRLPGWTAARPPDHGSSSIAAWAGSSSRVCCARAASI
jgi:hypothetical protein